MVPVSLSGRDGCLVSGKAVLEKVEDGKLIAAHHVGIGRSLDAAPDLGQCMLEDLADSRVLGAVWALACNLKSLCNSSVLWVMLVAVLGNVVMTHVGVAQDRAGLGVGLAMRHGVIVGRVLVVVGCRSCLVILELGRMDRQHCTRKRRGGGGDGGRECGHIYISAK